MFIIYLRFYNLVDARGTFISNNSKRSVIILFLMNLFFVFLIFKSNRGGHLKLMGAARLQNTLMAVTLQTFPKRAGRFPCSLVLMQADRSI